MYTYRTKGVCSREIHVDLDGDTIKHVDFVGGCDGNLKAIGQAGQRQEHRRCRGRARGQHLRSPFH